MPPVAATQATLSGESLPIVKGSSQNLKLAGSPLVECPEIEGSLPCKFMQGSDNSQSPLCPGCWSAKLWKVRNANSGNRRQTSLTGIIRLGTWREITASDWQSFKAGRGLRQDGSLWARPDFVKRAYFLITRGLEQESFYRDVVADPLALNIQVSVDIIQTSDGSTVQIPSDERLRFFLQFPKVLFRFKTLDSSRTHKGTAYESNTAHFLELQTRLGIPWIRVLETPLRLGTHSYSTTTPLEASGIASTAFLRCNTPCQTCPKGPSGGENRILVCAASEASLRHLAVRGNIAPTRQAAVAPVHVNWRALVVSGLETLGGEACLKDLYQSCESEQPEIARNPLWQLKVRQSVQRVAVRTAPSTWRLKTKEPV